MNGTAPGNPAPPSGSLRNASNGFNSAAPETPSVAFQDGANALAGPSIASAAPVPVKPVNRSVSSRRAIVHSSVQRRNPVIQELQRLKQTTEIGDIPCDYQVGEHAGLLFLSLKYHRLHPEYIHGRIEKIKNRYKLRILLVLCDVSEHHQSLRELSKIAILNSLTLVVAVSSAEAAQYIAQFKAFEHKSADMLKEKVHQTYAKQLEHVLISGKKVNKTDVENLAAQFGSFANMVNQPAKAISGVKGLGATKVTSLVDAFQKPFLVGGLRRTRDEDDSSLDIVNGTSARPIPTVPEAATGTTSAKSVNGTMAGNGTAEDTDQLNGIDGEDAGSPDWPEEGEEDGLMDGEGEVTVGRGREKVPSRSPGLSPEVPPGQSGALEVSGDESQHTWRDPLDDEEGDGEEDEGAPLSKRAKR